MNDNLLIYGAGEWNRTTDLRFTKPLLCQLSYGGSLYLLADLRDAMQPLFFVFRHSAVKWGHDVLDCLGLPPWGKVRVALNQGQVRPSP